MGSGGFWWVLVSSGGSGRFSRFLAGSGGFWRVLAGELEGELEGALEGELEGELEGYNVKVDGRCMLLQVCASSVCVPRRGLAHPGGGTHRLDSFW